MNKIFEKALLDSLLTAAYIALVSSFLYFAPGTFGEVKTVLIPIIMLLLFVISATITGSLVFGRSITKIKI